MPPFLLLAMKRHDPCLQFHFVTLFPPCPKLTKYNKAEREPFWVGFAFWGTIGTLLLCSQTRSSGDSLLMKASRGWVSNVILSQLRPRKPQHVRWKDGVLHNPVEREKIQGSQGAGTRVQARTRLLAPGLREAAAFGGASEKTH